MTDTKPTKADAALKMWSVAYRFPGEKDPFPSLLVIEATTEQNAKKIARQNLRAMYFRPYPRIAYVQQRITEPVKEIYS